MSAFNKKYLSFIEEKTQTNAEKMVRNKFYIIKEYTDVNVIRKKYSDNNAPIIYVLFASRPKDIIHAIKISDISVNKIKKLFKKLLNEKTDKLEMKGNSKAIYSGVINKSPTITSDAYRTYSMSRIGKVIEIDMDINELT